jgi:hypothetical protein
MSYYGMGTGGCRLGGSSSSNDDETDECDKAKAGTEVRKCLENLEI